MTGSVPDLRADINTKALDTLSWLVRKRDEGEISVSHFQTGIETMFSMASGIIDDDIMGIITIASKENTSGSISRKYKEGEV